jgi:hypothetical protein
VSNEGGMKMKKKQLGDYLYELAFQKRNRKIWHVFDNNHNLIASGNPLVLWMALGEMFSNKPIKKVLDNGRTIILDCEVKFNV